MSEGIQIKELLTKAARAAYLLKKISEGDHKAVENAADSSAELADIVERLGYDEAWFKEWRAQ